MLVATDTEFAQMRAAQVASEQRAIAVARPAALAVAYHSIRILLLELLRTN